MTAKPRFPGTGVLRTGVLAALLLGAGCGLEADSLDTPEPRLHPSESSSQERAESRFIAQDLEQLESPFTTDTVLELNSIVARSLEVIRQFDAERKAQQHREPSTSAAAAAYLTLSRKAHLARLDMAMARDEIVQSGEHYNEAILAAMVRFVKDVDREIALEVRRLET